MIVLRSLSGKSGRVDYFPTSFFFLLLQMWVGWVRQTAFVAFLSFLHFVVLSQVEWRAFPAPVSLSYHQQSHSEFQTATLRLPVNSTHNNCNANVAAPCEYVQRHKYQNVLHCNFLLKEIKREQQWKKNPFSSVLFALLRSFSSTAVRFKLERVANYDINDANIW